MISVAWLLAGIVIGWLSMALWAALKAQGRAA